MKTNASITIYNKYLDERTNKYSATQIRDVMWEDRKATNVIASGGNIASDQARLFIPMPKNLLTFKQPKAWLALVNKSIAWTLQVGDVIVKDLVDDVIDEEFTITNLKEKYDFVMTITSIDTRDMGSMPLRHWQVGLK